MNIIFYIDPFIVPISTYYIINQLKDEFNKNGHNLDICIPIKEEHDSYMCYVNQVYDKKYNYGITWFKFNPRKNKIGIDLDKYDILFISHIWSKKWITPGIDCRKVFMDKFKKVNKPVISLKLDLTLEYRSINNYVNYGVNTFNRILLPERWILPLTITKKFIVPSISNVSIEKNNALTRTDFYIKYNLDSEKKIIVFILGRFKKWYNQKAFNTNVIMIFFQKLKYIIDILNNNGYELLFKIHRADNNNILKNMNISNLNIIDTIDTYETFKYASRAISFSTCMVYELYLYDLPVLELGTGIYYPGWISDLSRNNNYIHNPFKKYNNSKDLIYGIILNGNLTKLNIESIFKHFLTTDFNINNFKYLTNHPVYGDSYYHTDISKISKILIDKCLTF
jgi:hypothetical protein